MKAIKILTFVIIAILVVGIGVGAYVYLYTDTFKPTKEIFYSYLKKENVEQLFESDAIEQILNKIENENNEQNIDLSINAIMDGENVLDNSNVTIKSKSQPSEEKAEASIFFGNNSKKDVLEIDTVKDQDKYGISFKDITNKYITLENNNLNIFWAKLGIANLDLDKIEMSEYISEVNKKQNEIKTFMSNLYSKINEQTGKENYSNLGKMQIELDGSTVEAKGYELNLTSDEVKQFLSSMNTADLEAIGEIDTTGFLGDKIENLGFNLVETVYVYEGKLAKIQIVMKDNKSQTIQIDKIFEKSKILSIQIENSEGTQIVLNVTDNSIDSNTKYKISLGVMAEEELQIVSDINVDIVFNTNSTITSLKDENSYIINNEAGDQIINLFVKIGEMIKEREGIEKTLIGIIYNINDSLFTNVEDGVQETVQENQ